LLANMSADGIVKGYTLALQQARAANPLVHFMIAKLLALTLIRRRAFALFRDDRGIGSDTTRHAQSRFNVGVVREGIAAAMPSLLS